MSEQYRPAHIENPERFRGETSAALQQLIVDGQHDELLGRIRRQHEYHIRNFGLKTPEEQHQRLVSALGYAVALHDFNVPRPETIKRRVDLHNDVVSKGLVRYDNDQIDDSFIDELLIASQEAMQDTVRLDQFAQSLRDAGLNPAVLSVAELVPEVVKGLETHWNLEGFEPRNFKDIHGFQRKFRQAFQDIVTDPRYTLLLERFRYTYEYKKQIPWRGESGGRAVSPEKAGLPYAISNALAIHRWGISEQKPEGTIPVDQAFRNAFLVASNVVTGNMWDLDGFAHSLKPSGLIFVEESRERDAIGAEEVWGYLKVDENPEPKHGLPKNVDEITVPQLSKEVAISLQSYWQRIHSGNSSDPW